MRHELVEFVEGGAAIALLTSAIKTKSISHFPGVLVRTMIERGVPRRFGKGEHRAKVRKVVRHGRELYACIGFCLANPTMSALLIASQGMFAMVKTRVALRTSIFVRLMLFLLSHVPPVCSECSPERAMPWNRSFVGV